MSPPPRTRVVDETYHPHPARRCGECHSEHYKAWQHSGHAEAATSKLYQQTRANGGAVCDRCHVPLASVERAQASVQKEGVSCEACHGISAVDHTPSGGQYELSLADNRKYGPVCDGNNHYFHKLGCAPIFVESKFCGSCHSWRRTLPTGTSLPVFTTYDEWLASGQTATCQDCHMQQQLGALATGSRTDRVRSDHGFGESLRAALVSDVELVAGEAVDDPWIVRIQLSNISAAHAVPAGMPGRALVLRVRAIGQDGRELAREEQSLRRVLVDATGEERPFYAATSEREDTRLQAGEIRNVRIAVVAPQAQRFVVELIGPVLTPAVATQMVVTDEPPQVRWTREIDVHTIGRHGG